MEEEKVLLHISKISKEHIEKVEDVLAVGDEVVVKVSDIDSQGRINLNMKDLEKSETSENKRRLMILRRDDLFD